MSDMARDEIMALETGPETDALVAEALGQHIHEWKTKRFGPSPGWGKDWYCERCGKWGHKFSDVPPPDKGCVKPYSTDIAAAYEAEDALPVLKMEAYAGALEDVLKIPPVWDQARSLIHTWRIAHAPPLDRCKALLMVLTEGGDDD